MTTPTRQRSAKISKYRVVNWLAQTRGIVMDQLSVNLCSRFSSFPWFVGLGQFVCHLLLIFFFFFLCIHVERCDRSDDGEGTTPAGRQGCLYRPLISLRRHRCHAHIGRLTCLECGSVSQLTINSTKNRIQSLQSQIISEKASSTAEVCKKAPVTITCTTRGTK